MLVTCSHQVAREFREFERASTTLALGLCAAGDRRLPASLRGQARRSGLQGPLHGDAIQRRTPARRGDAPERHHRALFRSRRPASSAPRARPRARASRISSPSTWAAPRPTSAWCRTAVPRWRPKPRSTACRSARPCSTSSRSARAAARSPGSTMAACCAVGPQSAGADPGPACYGRGGTEPATTDAHIVIGTIRPGAFLGGRMQLDGEAARRAFEPLAERFAPQRRAGRLLGAAARRRQHRARHPARLDRARPRSARLCAGAVRRRGPAACRAHRRGARHLHHRRAAQCRRDLGLRAGRLRLHQVRRRHAQDEARRHGGDATPAASSPRCASGSPRSSPT